MEPLAHSAKRIGDVPQTYKDHILGHRYRALSNLDKMLYYASSNVNKDELRCATGDASTFHDVGKLDPDIQPVFSGERAGPLPFDHIDAGVAYLSKYQSWMAAWLVRAHHSPGIPDKSEHFNQLNKNVGRRLRGIRAKQSDNDDYVEKNKRQIIRTDEMISEYIRIHESVLGERIPTKQRPIHGLTMRLLLSCIVDADYSDTGASSYGRGYELPEPPDPRWEERLARLCEYVRNLPKGKSKAERKRNRYRMEFFESCLNSEVDDPMMGCAGGTGLGKTTAVVANFIRRAIKYNLRRIIVVAHLTTILSQNARRLREALVLPGENPDNVIMEHHHKADFENRDDREMAARWDAPIVFTTAVSFFETLSSCHPAVLRKLHNVPGSAVFIDESHAAIPIHLWVQNWKWINELANNWGNKFVLASGSLVRFWENSEIINPPVVLRELVSVSQSDVLEDEKKRIHYEKLGILTVSELIKVVKSVPGPRLVIVDTIISTAVVAKVMQMLGMDVVHLSTALDPKDQSVIIDYVLNRLRFKDDKDWVLVATSLVEAGIEFSFRTGFREDATASSLIQVAGRVNRHGEYNSQGGGILYSFQLSDALITQHPGFIDSAKVLRKLMELDRLNTWDASKVVTEALKMEIYEQGGLSANKLEIAERSRNYPEVDRLGRVITSDTRFVVVDMEIKGRLERHEYVSFRELHQGSVQMWADKIAKYGLPELPTIRKGSDIYFWPYAYDPNFLGYMEGVLNMQEFDLSSLITE